MTGFLEFLTLCLLMPRFLCSLVLALLEEPLELVSEKIIASLCCCSEVGPLADKAEGGAIGRWRNIPGTMTPFFLGSIKPLFSSCNFSTASNFSLLVNSESEWRSFSSSVISVPLELWNPNKWWLCYVTTQSNTLCA